MSEVKTVNLADVLKAKGRYTEIRMGGGLGLTAKTELSVKDLQFPQADGMVVAGAQRNKRKLQNLNARLGRDSGALLLLGWDLPIYVDTEDPTGFTGSATINLWSKTEPATLETAEKLLKTIAGFVVFNNVNPRIGWHLYGPDRKSSIIIPAEMIAELPRHTLSGAPYVPPLHKCPLKDSELELLKQAEIDRDTLEVEIAGLEDLDPRTPEQDAELTKLRAKQAATKPLFKLFAPAGASTWLVYSMEDDGDTLWAVADIGQDCVEYGTVSIKHDICNPVHRMPVEKDKFFEGKKVTYTLLELCAEDRLPTNLYPTDAEKEKRKAQKEEDARLADIQAAWEAEGAEVV